METVWHEVRGKLSIAGGDDFERTALHYLCRARLSFRVTPYPWRTPDGSPCSAIDDLAEARRLIEKHGYWRRKEEMEDAEQMILERPYGRDSSRPSSRVGKTGRDKSRPYVCGMGDREMNVAGRQGC